MNWDLLLRVRTLLALVSLALWQGGSAANADTISGVFGNPVLSGNVLNETGIGSLTYFDNTSTAVIGTATPGGASCAGGDVLCWGTGADLAIPASEQYSELAFTGSTGFNSASSQSQEIGTISFLNGTSDLNSLIFGGTLNLYDNGVFVGSDNVIVSTTSNQYSGTDLTQAQLNTDADYVNICGNDSTICGSSIEAYEDSEGGTGVLVDLTGSLVGDPTLVLDGVTVDPSDANCTTCGVIGNEPGLAEVPEPSTLAPMAAGLILCIGLARRGTLRRLVQR